MSATRADSAIDRLVRVHVLQRVAAAFCLCLVAATSCAGKAPASAQFRVSHIVHVEGDTRPVSPSRSVRHTTGADLTCWYSGRAFGESRELRVPQDAGASRRQLVFDGRDTYLVTHMGRTGAMMHGRGRLRAPSAFIRQGTDPSMLLCGWARWLYFRNNLDIERSLSARPMAAQHKGAETILTAIVPHRIPYPGTDPRAKYAVRATRDRSSGDMLVLFEVHKGSLTGPLVREVRASDVRVWPGGKRFPARIVERTLDSSGRCVMTDEYSILEASFRKAVRVRAALPHITSATRVSDRRFGNSFTYTVTSRWLTRSEAAAQHARRPGPSR